MFAIGCDSFQFNPTSPSPISRNSGGPELRIHPNIGSIDYQKMFTNPEEWAEARSKISVFQFHHANTMSVNGCTMCFTPDGRTNGFEDMAGVSAFQKLSEWGIPVSIEMGSLKHHNCENPETEMQHGLNIAMAAIQNVTMAGGRVIDVSMDEPFMGGMLRFAWDGQNVSGCEYTPEKTAQITMDYWIKPLQAAFPDVQVGLTEAYPTFDVKALQRNIIALEQAGYRLPFLHIDYDRYGAIREDYNIERDMRELQAFARSRGIKFGMVIWGENAMSTEMWYSDAMAMATRWRNSLGSAPDRIIIESWGQASEQGTVHLGSAISPRYYPNNLPETQPGTMTYMINQMSLFFR